MAKNTSQPDYMKWLPPSSTATISRCELFGRTMKSGFISGRHRSPKKGFSVEFAEHRQYVAGDDLRNLALGSLVNLEVAGGLNLSLEYTGDNQVVAEFQLTDKFRLLTKDGNVTFLHIE